MKLLFVVILLLGSLFLLNQSTLFHNKHKVTEPLSAVTYLSYENAVKEVKKSHKVIMLKLTTAHCSYCKKMDREVFLDKEVIAFLSKYFISVEIDVEHEPIPLGIKRTITPTFIFIDKEENILSRIPGSWNKKDFLDLLNNRIEK